MDPSPDAVWNACLEVIRDNIPRQSFATWFGPIKAVSLEASGELRKLTIQLPSRFYYEWLEEHYHALLRKTLVKVLGPGGRLFYKIVVEQDDAQTGHPGAMTTLPGPAPSAPRPPRQDLSRQEPSRQDFGARQDLFSGAPPARPSAGRGPGGHPTGGVSPGALPASAPGRSRPASEDRRPGGTPGMSPAALPASPYAAPGMQPVALTAYDANLNASYLFDRFVEGDCNRLARAAAMAIAENPGTTSFNPLVVYGGVGLGKTHLIQAIGNHALGTGKVKSVLYVSSERFMQEFLQGIRDNRREDFSRLYRSIDLLIVDDIQFFAGKEKTQEEFFHVFNALHQSGKQIILSSDRSPRDLAGMEERLLSRFQWGLSADLQAPELETRIAILQRKAHDEDYEFDPDVLEFIAENVTSNIRELEGALLRLLAHATLNRRDIDVTVAREVLRDLIKESRALLTVEDLQRIVSGHFNLDERLLRDKTRKREIVNARQIAMHYAKALTPHSLKDIGQKFGGRDHSTVIHALRSVEDQIDTSGPFRETMGEIQRLIDRHVKSGK